MNIQKPRGTQDIYGSEMKDWHYVERHIRSITERYQFTEIRTPMFERIEVFARSVGESSDIVSKEMYEFMDKGNRQMALKPESTAAIVRAYVENKLFAEGDYQKYYYISPTFRYERQQAGRYRQHHQFGFEVFGDKNPLVDGENILFVHTFLQELGIRDYTVKINSLGDTDSRARYREALQAHFKPVITELCEDCQKRIETNPLRILDCKTDAAHPSMKTAPKLSDYLTAESKKYFEAVLRFLDTFAIPYTYDQTLVRGLDYYTDTVFEFVLNNETSAKAGSLCGGGRYNGLVETFGGPEKAGFGCGIGIERLILALKEQGVEDEAVEEERILVANISGDMESLIPLEIVQKLRVAGLNVETNFQKKSMKAVFKMADRFEATDIVIIGEEELHSNTVQLRNVATREQETLTIDALLEKFV